MNARTREAEAVDFKDAWGRFPDREAMYSDGDGHLFTAEEMRNGKRRDPSKAYTRIPPATDS
jgi:hypothetical protein